MSKFTSSTAIVFHLYLHSFTYKGTYRTSLGMRNTLGPSNATFYLPQDVKIGPDGLVYVADTGKPKFPTFLPVEGNLRIQVFNDTTYVGTVSTRCQIQTMN